MARGSRWQPGAGGMCLHTILLDPSDPERIFIAISAAGAFRTDDGGETWKPINRGLRSEFIPDPSGGGGALRSSHRDAPLAPGCAVHAEALGRDAQRRRGRLLARGQRESADRFRISSIDVHAHEPETIYVVPIKSDRRTFSAGWKAAGVPQPDGRERVGGA